MVSIYTIIVTNENATIRNIETKKEIDWKGEIDYSKGEEFLFYRAWILLMLSCFLYQNKVKGRWRDLNMCIDMSVLFSDERII